MDGWVDGWQHCRPLGCKFRTRMPFLRNILSFSGAYFSGPKYTIKHVKITHSTHFCESGWWWWWWWWQQQWWWLWCFLEEFLHMKIIQEIYRQYQLHILVCNLGWTWKVIMSFNTRWQYNVMPHTACRCQLTYMCKIIIWHGASDPIWQLDAELWAWSFPCYFYILSHWYAKNSRILQVSMFIPSPGISSILFSMLWCRNICNFPYYLSLRVKMANSMIPCVFYATREIPISRIHN